MRRQDETAWMLMMSDTIHPNMTGHRRFAELITKTVSGKDVDLTGVTPPADGMHHTFESLERKEVRQTDRHATL